MPKDLEVLTIKMDEVIRLPEIQIRSQISKKTVVEYAEMIGEGTTFDPVDVFLGSGGEYILADGWHRFMARQERGLTKIEVKVHAASGEDVVAEAIEFSCERNSHHGLRMSSADKRSAIETILKNALLRRRSDRAISKMVGVSPSLVKTVRSELANVGKEEATEPKKKAAPRTSTETAAAEPDDASERMKSLKSWVESGYIEWSHIVEIFSSRTHFPALLPKEGCKIRIVKGSSKRSFIAEKMTVLRKGELTILEVIPGAAEEKADAAAAAE